MDEWAGRLARGYAACRGTYPEDTALIVLDDRALLDERDRPRPGVTDVVRLFEMQPLTRVALMSDRPADAVQAALHEYDLAFDADLVRVRPPDGSPADHLRATLRDLGPGRAGYRVAAVIHSNTAVVKALDGSQVLALPTPAHAEHGGPVELVWHRVNQQMARRQFLASPIRWAEVDLRCDDDGRLVVHHGDLDPATSAGREITEAGDILRAFREAGKGLNLDVKDPSALGATLDAVADHGFPDEDVWVNGRVDHFGEDRLRSVKKRFPGSRLQCPLEFIGPVAATMPDVARQVVERMGDWGVDRFSLAWTHPDTPLIRDRLDEWGLELNLYAITDLEQVVAAMLTVPRSLTADFALPEWHYFGRGQGNDGEFHRDPGKAAADPPGIDVA
jgi:hypothetical protein